MYITYWKYVGVVRCCGVLKEIYISKRFISFDILHVNNNFRIHATPWLDGTYIHTIARVYCPCLLVYMYKLWRPIDLRPKLTKCFLSREWRGSSPVYRSLYIFKPILKKKTIFHSIAFAIVIHRQFKLFHGNILINNSHFIN